MNSPAKLRPATAPALFALFALLPLALAACGAQTLHSVRARALLGEFTGEAGQALKGELQSRRTFGGRDGSAPLLSVDTSFQLDFHSEKETVVTEEAAGNELVWEEDRLTGQVYLTREANGSAAEDYDFERAEGALTAKWRLTDPGSGSVLSDGVLVYTGERSFGNYISNRGRPSSRPGPEQVRRDILQELVREAASGLIETTGPQFTSGDLAPAADSLSQKARSLVAGGDWEGASLLWGELLSQNPSYVPALYNLGLYKEKTGELSLAWEYYRHAFLVDQSPMCRQALTRVTDVLRRQNQLPRASRLSD
jgi:tetratricopeptide (TPR) repeat protein